MNTVNHIIDIALGSASPGAFSIEIDITIP